MKTHSAKLLLLAAAFLVVAVSGVKAQTWSFTGNMNVFRFLHVALLPSGELLVAAGMATKTAELYDPSSGSFSYTGSLTDERDSGARAVLLDSGADLVTGGEWNYRVYRTHFWNTAEIYQ